jgi:hypothetical protein
MKGTPPPLHHPTLDIPTGTALGQHVNDTQPPGVEAHDLMHRVTGMYRLLDLISEQGSGGAGEYLPVGITFLESS